MYKRSILIVFVVCMTMFSYDFVKVNADLEPTGLAKPVANLRDYNGTNFGSPNTGGIGYTTLYRDSYTGCDGEGCGKHPGVDIPVPSNTNVYASIGGTVVISRCNWSYRYLFSGYSSRFFAKI